MTYAVIGLDAGGTKTTAALTDLSGQLLMRTRGGSGNYHAIGLDAARERYDELITPLRHEAARRGLSVVGLGAGLSGLDRPIDKERLESTLRLVLPSVPLTVVNDTYLILRAGVSDGVGIAVVSGTGSNVVARARSGQLDRIGGFGSDFGDDGGAGDIGRSGLRAVFRAADGRDPPTSLGQLLCERLGLASLEDLVERFLVDAETRIMTVADLAPLVFEGARDGDAVCRAILADAGEALGHAAVVVAQRCFQPQEAFGLVLGGSVLQHGVVDIMRDALTLKVKEAFPALSVHTLDRPPLLGAVLLALDALDLSFDRSRAASSLRAAF